MRNAEKTVNSLKYITVLDGCDFYAEELGQKYKLDPNI